MIVNISLNVGNAQPNDPNPGPFEAIRFTGTQESYDEVAQFLGSNGSGSSSGIIWHVYSYKTDTMEGGYDKIYISGSPELKEVAKGDWIIKCLRPNIFIPMTNLDFTVLFNYTEKKQ